MIDFDYAFAVTMPVIAPPPSGSVPADHYSQLGLSVTVSRPDSTNKSVSVTVDSAGAAPDTRLFAPIGGMISYIPQGQATPLTNSFVAPAGGALRLQVWLWDILQLAKDAPTVARDLFFTGIDQAQTELALKVLLLQRTVDQLRAMWASQNGSLPPQNMTFSTLLTDCMNLLMAGNVSFFVKCNAVIGRLPLSNVQTHIDTSVTITANRLTGEFTSPIRIIRSLPWFDTSLPPYMNDHPLYMSVRKSPVIDPGHGGSTMVGGSSASNAKGTTSAGVVIHEKDKTLLVGLHCRDVLNKYGFNTVMTRETDVNIGLAARVTVASSIAAPSFVAIHFNDSDDHVPQGTETFCHPVHRTISEDLCVTVQSKVLAATGYADRNSGFPNGVKTQVLAVLNQASHAAGTACCLTEISFMDVTSEADRLATDAYVNQLGLAIANAVEEYISTWDD